MGQKSKIAKRLGARLAWAAFSIAICAAICGNLAGCMSAYKRSVGAETETSYHRIFLTDFNTAWQATLEALKSNALDVSNRDAGFIQTRWKDNTALKNLAESYGTTSTYLKAQYRFRVNIAKGTFNNKPSVRVTVQKDQLLQRDVLEGWRGAPSDSIEENTLLYRIGRLIAIRLRINQIEDEKANKAVESGF